MNQIDAITYKVAELLDRRNDQGFIMSLRDTLWNIRATYLRQDFNKNLLYRPESIQDLGCIKLVAVPEGECNIPKNCNLKRTECPIPTPIDTKYINQFMYLGSTDGSPDYQPTTEFENENACYEPFPALYPTYFRKNGYIYVINGKNSINIRTMFVDPREAAEFCNNDGANCAVLENAYIPKDMVKDIEAEILRLHSVEKSPENDEIKL